MYNIYQYNLPYFKNCIYTVDPHYYRHCIQSTVHKQGKQTTNSIFVTVSLLSSLINQKTSGKIVELVTNNLTTPVGKIGKQTSPSFHG